jgi:hypothetical protein
MSPIVPITDVKQVEEAAEEVISQNDAQTSSEIDFENQSQEDETDAENDADSLAATIPR